MEIRALTGFDKNTRERYGRSYTPLNGTCNNCSMGNLIIIESPYPELTDLEWTKMSAQNRINYGRNRETKPTERVKNDSPLVEDSSKAIYIYKGEQKNKSNKALKIAGAIAGAYLLYKIIK